MPGSAGGALAGMRAFGGDKRAERRLGQFDRQLDIQAGQLDVQRNQEARQLIGQVQTNISNFVKQSVQALEKGGDVSGKKTLLEQFDKVYGGALGSVLPPSFLASQRALIENAKTKADIARAEGSGKVAAVEAGLGREPTEREKQKALGVDQPEPQIVKLQRIRTSLQAQMNETQDPAERARIEQEITEITGNIDAIQRGQVLPDTGDIDKPEARNLSVEMRGLRRAVGSLRSLITPDASGKTKINELTTGLSGVVGEAVAPITQIPVIGSVVNLLFTDDEINEIVEARSDFISQIRSVVNLIATNKSGRFSNQDTEDAKRALPLLKAGASPEALERVVLNLISIAENRASDIEFELSLGRRGAVRPTETQEITPEDRARADQLIQELRRGGP